MATTPPRLEALADDLTRVLNIPFRASGRASIVFREPLRVTDWSVPMIFDGHAVRDGGGLVPIDFVGHALFASLRSTSEGGDGRPWWSSTLSEHAARAIVEAVEDAGDEGWVVGRDVLLDDPEPEVVRRPRRPLAREVA
jgi:hypothetical protein